MAVVREMSRATIRERFFPLHQPGDVDRFLDRFPWSVVFKAGTSQKTMDAWAAAETALEPRVDLAIGFIRLPEDRPASDRVSTLSAVPHRSPQLLLFRNTRAVFHLDEFAIVSEQIALMFGEHLPAALGPVVRNEAMVTLEPYRRLLSAFVSGSLPEARFQWSYLERLESEAGWRDDETFAVLNSLFENERGRDVRAARLIAVEFQGQLAGRLEPLNTRAARVLERLTARGGPDDRLL
jgi:bacillithiol system protein YtxJ